MERSLQNNKTSDAKFDILKLVMSFFVAAIHMMLFPEVLYPWLRMAVPLFFIMTGYFFFGKLQKLHDYKAQKSAVKGFVLRNLKLYAFWFTVMLPYIFYIRREVYFGNETILGDIFAIVRGLLFRSTFTASWYIISSIYGVLIIFFLLRKVKNSVLFVLASLLYVMISLLSSYETLVFKSEVVKTGYDIFTTIFEIPTTSLLIAVVWLLCGKFFAEGFFKSNKLLYAIIMVVSGVALYAEWLFVKHLDQTINNDCYFMLMPFCIGVFGFINSFGKVTVKYSINMRRLSTIIFVTHGMVGRILSLISRKLFGEVFIPVAYVVNICICIGIYLLLEFVYTKCKDNKLGKILQYAF